MKYAGSETTRGRIEGALRRTRVLASLILLAFLVAPLSHALSVKEIRFWSLGEITRVVVQFDGEFQYKWARLDNPPRVFFDLPGSDLDVDGIKAPGKVRTIDVSDPVLKQIRYAENSPGNARVVLDLATDCELKASQLANPPRLIIELRNKATAGTPIEVSRTGAVGSGSSATPVAPPPAPATAVAETPVIPAPAPEKASARAAPTATPQRSGGKAPEETKIAEAKPSKAPRTESRPLEPAAAASRAAESKPPRPKAAEPKPARTTAPAEPKPAESVVAEVGGETIATTPAAPVAAPASESAAPAEETGVALATPATRTVTGQQSLVRALGLKLGKIVIDPGHGGKDQGTSAGPSFHEKDLVLDVAKRLKALIESELGTEVVLTREDDVFIDLEERTAIANQHRADLFLSLHANSSPFKLASGSETFYLNFTSSREAMDIAARENASSTRSIADLQDIVKRIALKDKRDESRDLAAKVQNALYKTQRGEGIAKKNRGVKAAPFIVLIGADMPSVLVEIGFLSNAKERSALEREKYRQSIAEGLLEGLKSYVSSLSHFENRERAAREE